MMGETGPCGPCSELHVDLTPQGDTKGSLVNKGSAECIEIWNLVSSSSMRIPTELFAVARAARGHWDGIRACHGDYPEYKTVIDFSRVISNYETDIFRPLFDKSRATEWKEIWFDASSGRHDRETEQEKIDIAFRVIADHIRTLSLRLPMAFGLAITTVIMCCVGSLRRAVRYAANARVSRTLFLQNSWMSWSRRMGDVFPEIREKRNQVEEVIHTRKRRLTRRWIRHRNSLIKPWHSLKV